VAGRLLAVGGNAFAYTGQGFGFLGGPGDSGAPGAAGQSGSGASGQGGDGGFGGHGGSGGVGGLGGPGGPGAAGAGGTVKIVGSVVTSTSASVNVQGGLDALGGSSPDGGDGRLLFGSNSGSFSGALTGGTELAFAGPMRSNPLIAGGPQTPFIPELVGGAEAFGPTTLTAADFPTVVAGAPTGAVAALVLQHVGPSGYGDAFPGFDMLFFVNLLNQNLADPRLGAGTAAFTDTLLQEGFGNDPLFGGSGAQVLSQLGTEQVYATLVPSGTTGFNASVVLGATTVSGSASSLAGGPLYLVTRTDQTISFGPLANHTYGDAPFTVSATASSGLPVSFTILSGPATISGNQVSITGTGTVVVEASQAGDASYSAAPVVDQSFTVNPAPLTITADDQTTVYGAGLPALTASYSGFVNGDTPASLTTAPSLSTTATAASPVGSYSITAAGAADSDYTISYVSGTLSITPATLTVTADNQTKTYGAALPALTASYSGFVNGDKATALSGSASVTTTATAGSPPGTYSISVGPGNLADANYQFTFVNGTLTVTPAPLSATAVNFTATTGAPFLGAVAMFINADPFGSINSYSASIAWGDGSVSAGAVNDLGNGSFQVSGQHTYAGQGNDVVSVTISHKLGYTTAATVHGSATVVNLGIGVQHGESAGIGYWQNKNGQALIDSFNGGPTSTALSSWLAATLTDLYGTNAGSHNLSGMTNAQVAAFYVDLFNQQGPKLDAQMLDTALDVYATTLSLDGTAAQSYGFDVTANGLGASTYNVGANGAAFGVANDTTLTVFAILEGADSLAAGGVLYNGDLTLRQEALNVFSGINELGGL
jgi:hypothetical protein